MQIDALIRLTGVALLAAIVCMLALHLLLRSGWAWKLAVDLPNARSLHVQPVPRVGGIGLLAGALPLIWLMAPELQVTAAAMLLIAAISFLDDRIGLPVAVRLLAHAGTVSLMLWHLDLPVSAWIIAGIALFWIWMINLYNFMDGSDGLAGGMALFGFTSMALAAGAGDGAGNAANGAGTSIALAAAALAGAAAGFLTLNFQPARVFLGDAGSIALGFAAGAIGLAGWNQHLWPIWFPLLVFSPFIADASITLLRRLLNREQVWRAHRSHYYQRTIRLGLSHRRTALAAYVLMVLASSLALILLYQSPLIQALGIGAWTLTLILVGLTIDLRWAHHTE